MSRMAVQCFVPLVSDYSTGSSSYFMNHLVPISGHKIVCN